MIRRTTWLPLLLTACGPKAGPPMAAADAAAEPDAGLPGDPTSKAFVENLASLEIRDFAPLDDPEVRLVYREARFSPDGTWSASAEVVIAAVDESMGCRESGTWTMEPAESATRATLTWTIASTDCAGREAGQSLRVVAEIADGELRVRFH